MRPRHAMRAAIAEAAYRGKAHTDVWLDEAVDLTPRQARALAQYGRKQQAELGWPNWYINRGRLSLNPSKSELRRVSWRRAH